jgi:hypothetical protein
MSNIMSSGSILDDPDMVIAVVDAKTGDSLHYVSPTAHENLMKNMEKTRASIERSLKTFPKAGPPATAAPKRPSYPPKGSRGDSFHSYQIT